LLTLPIIQLKTQQQSAEHKNCTGADGASSGQKTKGCMEGEDQAASGIIFNFLIGAPSLRPVSAPTDVAVILLF